MDSPLNTLLNLAKGIVNKGKSALTSMQDDSSNLGIAKNTVIGLPQATKKVGTAIKDIVLPTRWDSESEFKQANPNFKDQLTGVGKGIAEISSGLGNLGAMGAQFLPGYTKAIDKFAQTKIGDKLGYTGQAIEEYAKPETAEQAKAMRYFDIASFLPMGSTKTLTASSKAIANSKVPSVIFKELRMAGLPKKIAEDLAPKLVNQKDERFISQLIVKNLEDARVGPGQIMNRLAETEDIKAISKELKAVDLPTPMVARIAPEIATMKDPKVIGDLIKKSHDLYDGVAPTVARTVSPDDIRSMKAYINDTLAPGTLPKKIDVDSAEYLLSKYNIKVDQPRASIAAIFNRILTGDKKVTNTVLSNKVPGLIERANSILAKGKKAITEVQPRDVAGRFNVKTTGTKVAKSEPLYGTAAGLELTEDEQGNKTVGFDPMKAAFGFAGMTAFNKGSKFVKGKASKLPPVDKTSKSLLPSIKPNVSQSLPALKVSSYVDDIPKIANSQVNLSTINISDEGKNLINKTIDEVKPSIEKSIGAKLSNKEAIDLAEKSSKIMQRAVSREKTLEWEAAMLRTRQKLAQSADSGRVDKEFIDNLLAVKSLGTDIGRKLQSLSISADPKDITSMQAIIEAVLKVTDNTDEILKQAQGVDFTNLKEATEFYRRFVKPTSAEWIDLIRYNSMLSSPNTHIVNVFSNFANTMVVAPIEKALIGGLDFLASNMSGKDRQYFAGEGAVYAVNYLKNVSKAYDNFLGVMQGTKKYTNLDLKYLPIATEGTQGKIVSSLSVPMKLLEGMDQFFSTLGEGAQRAALNYRKGKGVKVGNIETLAFDDAQYRVFRQPLNTDNQGYVLDAIDTVTSKIQDIRNTKNPIISTVARFTVPFLQTPMNIFKQGIEYSPAGFATLIGAKNKTEQLARAIIGSTIFASSATLLASNRLSWSEPVNEEERNAFRAAGKLPYSVKVGDKWMSYQKLPPALAFPFAMTAALDDALKNKKIDQTTSDMIITGIAKWGEFLADQSYFKSIGDLLTAFKGGESAISKVIGNYPQQLVPMKSFLGWFARMFDDIQRKVDKNASFVEKQVQSLMMSIPGLSQKVPARLNAEGNPIRQPDRISNLFSPIKTSTETDYGSSLDSIKQEVRKAYEAGKVDITTAEAMYQGRKKTYLAKQKKERANLSSDKYEKSLQQAIDKKEITKEEARKEWNEYQTKLSEKLKGALEVEAETPERSAVQLVSTYAKALGTDPVNAFKALVTSEKLGKVEGKLVQLQRFRGIPYTDKGGSEEYMKRQLALMDIPWSKRDQYNLEHIIPVSAGGDNSAKNLQIISRALHNSYTKWDTSAGNAVKAGRMTRKEIENIARMLKVERSITLEDALRMIK